MSFFDAVAGTRILIDSSIVKKSPVICISWGIGKMRVFSVALQIEEKSKRERLSMRSIPLFMVNEFFIVRYVKNYLETEYF
jgi:hypothetical protein